MPRSKVAADDRRTTRSTSPLREAHKAATRNLLADAALAAFDEKSYVDVTVDDIISAAGTSRATFYLHFNGKAAVLQELIRKVQLREDYQVIYQKFATMQEPSVEKLQAWLDEYVDFYSNNLGLHRAIHQAQAVEPEFTQARLRAVNEYISFWESLGFVTDADSATLRTSAVMTFALADETMYLWLVGGVDLDREKVTRGLAESFYATLTRG
jgi:AcrR family transcriptional regulator